MDWNILRQAAQDLLNANSPQAATQVLENHPDLLGTEAIEQLRQWAEHLRINEQEDNAKTIERIAQTLEETSEMESAREQQRSQTPSQIPLSSDPLARWARFVRQYLTQHDDGLLEQAIEAIQPSTTFSGATRLNWLSRQAGRLHNRNDYNVKAHSPEHEIIIFLHAVRAEQWDVIAQTGPILQHKLHELQREEESITVLLVCLNLQARLTELFIDFPPEQQAHLFDVALAACEQAYAISSAFDDDAGRAFYSVAAGTGFWNAHRFAEAERAYSEGLGIRRRLAEQQPGTFEPEIIMTLNNLANVFIELNKPDEAEAAFEEAITRIKLLVLVQPERYEDMLVQTLNNFINFLEELQQLEKVEAAIQEILAIYRRLATQHPQIYEIYVYANARRLGNTLSELYRLEESEEVFRESLIIIQRLQEASEYSQEHESDLVQVLFSLGTVIIELGRPDEAEQFLRRSLTISRRLAAQRTGHEGDLATTLNSLGGVFRSLRRLTEAEAAYQESLSIRKRLVGQFQGAHEQERQKIESDVAMTLQNLGVVFMELNRIRDAETFVREAIGIYRRLTEEQPRKHEAGLGQALNTLGIILKDLDPWAGGWGESEKEAGAVLSEAASLYRFLAQEKPEAHEQTFADILSNLGTLFYQLEQMEEAEAPFRESLSVGRRLAEQHPQIFEPKIAPYLNNLGRCLQSLHRLEEAKVLLEEARIICRHHDVPNGLILTAGNLGQLLMEQGQLEEAAETLYEGVAQVERLRAELLSLDQRIQLSKKNASAYECLLICLIKLERYEEALQVAEQGKSRAIVDLLTLRDLRPRNAPPEVVLEYERMLFLARALQDKLQSFPGIEQTEAPAYERASQGEERELQRQNLVQTHSRLRELTRTIRHHDPDFLPHAKPLLTADIRDLSKSLDATLILFRVTEMGSFVFLVFPNGESDVVKVPAFTAEVLRKLQFQIINKDTATGWQMRYLDYQGSKGSKKVIAKQRWMEEMDEAGGTLEFLYQNLLKPIHERLRATPHASKHLVLVPNRGLAILPLHACWWEEDEKRKCLLDEYIIRYVPSLSILKRCWEREHEGRNRDTLLGIANPTEDLTFSELECDEVQQWMDDERCLILRRERANKAEVRHWMGRRSYLHFSCHAEYQLGTPFESSILLADKERLTLGEIFEGVHLPKAWLVVLSACETGLVDYQGATDEHIGLPTGFLYAGAPTVYCSLWGVDDFSTALLMGKVYEKLINENLSKPNALCAAQLWLRDLTAGEVAQLLAKKEKSIRNSSQQHRIEAGEILRLRQDIEQHEADFRPFAHPYYWAAFQCVGA